MLEDPYDRHRPEEQHAGPTIAVYMIIFAVLSVCTAISFLVNWMEHGVGLEVLLGVAIILLVAVIKATLVAMYFMHLKWDWTKIFFLMIPVMILTVMMVIVLMPDLVLSDLPQP